MFAFSFEIYSISHPLLPFRPLFPPLLILPPSLFPSPPTRASGYWGLGESSFWWGLGAWLEAKAKRLKQEGREDDARQRAISREREWIASSPKARQTKSKARIKQFDGRSSFYTWFYRLVVNLCLDHTRRKGKVVWERLESERDDERERKELTDNTSGPDQEAIAGETKRRVDKTLDAMPNKQRTAFILRNHEGLPIADIAKVMKTTEGTVRVYLHRAIAALRRSLVELV